MEGITQTLIFEVEYPCYLEVRLIDKDTDEPITKDGTIILQTPFTGDVVKTFTSDMNGVISPIYLEMSGRWGRFLWECLRFKSSCWRVISLYYE